MRPIRHTLQFAAVLLCGFVSMALAQSPGPLNGQIFGSGNKALVVVLHGDVSKGGLASYHYDIAKRIAQQNRGVTTFALVRPGYTGQGGQKSRGSNNGRRDHYTSRNNKLVAQTIQNLAKATGNTKVIGIGHSGGAAQLGAIAGMYPGLMDSVILVSCPCNLTEWRSKRGKSPWRSSKSPHAFLKRVAPGTRILAVVGTRDTNTFPKLSQDYVAAAKRRGLPAAYVPVNGASHGFNRLQRTVEQLAKKEIAN